MALKSNIGHFFISTTNLWHCKWTTNHTFFTTIEPRTETKTEASYDCLLDEDRWKQWDSVKYCVRNQTKTSKLARSKFDPGWIWYMQLSVIAVYMNFNINLLHQHTTNGILTDLPVTHRNMYPSSCNTGILSRLISSSDIVPYGSSIWISQGGSAIMTANLPSTDMFMTRRSHCIHCNANHPLFMHGTVPSISNIDCCLCYLLQKPVIVVVTIIIIILL
jgi:hypothetical protein